MTRRPIPITRHISLIYRYAQRFLSGRLRDFPLEAGQLPLMLQLYRYPGVTQEQLAQRLAIDKGTAARGVAQLEKNGLVERREDPADRRAYRLAPTSRALSLEEPLFAITDRFFPPVLKKLADEPRGLILVTGPTGSGKSTTLASMIDYINQNRSDHILTIEDPIEYVYKSKKALIHQREVGSDVTGFAAALRSALREDPDVILVGEMRDYETISAAVTAAETGHLVMSTLHTIGAAQTIDRIIDVCPPGAQSQIRGQLSTVLRGVITQQLLPLATGRGRCAATEILVGSDAVCNLIRENKCFQIPSVLQSGAALGMHSLNGDLARLVDCGKITREAALRCSTDKKDLEQYF